MKLLTLTLFAAGVVLLAVALSACSTTTADGTTRTVDPLAYQTALVALAEYQRQHPVRPDK